MTSSGERVLPSTRGGADPERLHRYALALELVRGKIVLHLAESEGFGSALLSSVAASVVRMGLRAGVDRASSANEDQQRPNPHYCQGRAAEFPLPTASFDVVVSFETIGDRAELELILAEIRRVLRPDGLLVISFPPGPVNSDKNDGPFESALPGPDFSLLDELLCLHFPVIAYFGQRLLVSSAIHPLNAQPEVSRVWSGGPDMIETGITTKQEPVCYVAVCGLSEIREQVPGMSAFYATTPDLMSRYQQAAEWASSLERVVTERERQISRLNQTVAAQQEQIAVLMDSASWRLTAPLRESRRRAKALKSRLKNRMKSFLRVVREGYRILPFSIETKAAHQRWIARRLPRLLSAAGVYLDPGPLYPIPTFDQQCLIERDFQINPSELVIHTTDSPIISVIIPIFGNIDFTLRCLYSIARYTPKVPFEVIVVDDYSPDNSWETLSKVRGIRLLRNDKNEGFIRTCNAGAKSARGEYLCFLNNDTQVMPGWLDELQRTFSEFPGTGLAGSKLIYPDGRLQEAGGIIWQDGSAWNFGRFQNPQLPIYNYAREVDYCSGASIMVPKSLFDELGGFDEHYLPAYCEDSDLALKIRDRGLRVIYQPLSTVIHFEGITSGTDTTQGTKSYQVANTEKQFERWKDRLRNHQPSGTNVDSAKDRTATRRALVLDHCTPTPDQDSGSITVFNTLLLLREMNFQVTFIPEDNFLYLPDGTTTLQRAGIEVLYAPYVKSVEQHLQESGRRYDLALLFRPGVVERQVKAVRKYCPNAKVLFNTVDLHHLRMSREAHLLGDKAKMRAATKMQRREFAAIQASDASILLSTAELEMLKPLLPGARLHVTPLTMDVKSSAKPFNERRNIVFIGGFQHPPNIDAVKFFVDEVMPLLRSKLPGIQFYIVGSRTTAEVEALAADDVIVTGYVRDLTRLLSRMRVSVAPLRYGAGIKGKIGTAMAVGLPVVATTVAAEGMSLTNEQNIMIADRAEALADAIVKVYQHEDLWNRLSANGLAFADQAWGAETAWRILAAILADLGLPVSRRPHPLSLYKEWPDRDDSLA